jgi:hypothetical protein
MTARRTRVAGTAIATATTGTGYRVLSARAAIETENGPMDGRGHGRERWRAAAIASAGLETR